MKAAVWKGIDHLDIDEVPAPTPQGPYDVQVKVVSCGVCATDAHILENKFPMFKAPRIIGHEHTGTVSAVGKDVKRVKVGDRVAVESGISCDRCYFCRDGREHLCLDRFVHPGGFAEYVCVTERQIHKLPLGISFEVGALSEPLACVLRAIDLVQFRSGDVALVQGGGTIGCILTQLLIHGGASKVLVSEPVPHRRDIAKAVGVSNNYLSLIFGQELGLSPWEYLNRFRIVRAQELLRGTEESVTAIAARTGFEDSAYFSRVFRKLVGQSPQHYRQHLAGDK